MRLDEASQSNQQPDTSELAPPLITLPMRRAGFFSTARLALLRASHTRWLLLVVALGILLADILICAVPLYNTLVSNVQLQNAIANSAGVKSNMQVSVQTTTVNRDLQQQADAIIRKTQRQYLGAVSRPTPTDRKRTRLNSSHP